MKRGVFLLIFLVLLELASAEIIIDNVEGVYNIGDEVNLSFSIEKQKSVSDYLKERSEKATPRGNYTPKQEEVYELVA